MTRSAVLNSMTKFTAYAQQCRIVLITNVVHVSELLVSG